MCEEFPIFSNVRVISVEDDTSSATGGRLRALMDVDLSDDNLTLAIETALILNYPTPLSAVLPVALAVSVVRFQERCQSALCPLHRTTPRQRTRPNRLRLLAILKRILHSLFFQTIVKIFLSEVLSVLVPDCKMYPKLHNSSKPEHTLGSKKGLWSLEFRLCPCPVSLLSCHTGLCSQNILYQAPQTFAHSYAF
jgi:hypothetical protein